MPRPFAVIGFTVFFTIALLYNSDTGAIAGVLSAFFVALVASIFASEARKQKVLPCAFASGIIACILLIAEINFCYLPAVDYSGKTCRIYAQLTDYPESNYGNFYFDAKAIEINGEETELKMRLVFSSLPDAQPYDYVEGDFKFYALGSTSDEFLASNKAKGVFVGAYPQSGKYSVHNIPDEEKPFAKKILDIREMIKNAVHRAVPGDSGALATALLIGDRSNLSSEILSDFRLSGLTHIICVSGFHLSLCANFILALLRKLRVGELLSSIITAVAVVMFMLVAGMTYSVIRSGIMMLLFLLANVLRKSRDSLNSLGLALAVIAVYNPFASGSVGLQLSALSTLGLILYSQYIKPKIDEHIRKTDNVYLRDILLSFIGAVSVPFFATALTTPVLIKVYNEFNFSVYFSNILAVPIASVCILLSAIAALFGGKAGFIGTAADVFCKLFLKISDFFAGIDLFTFRSDSDTGSVIICGVLLVCAMSVFMAYSGKKLTGLTCALCAAMFTFGLMFSSVSRESETRINVVDVGNGTAVLATKNGENFLIGCGGTDLLGASKISSVLRENGSSLDFMIVPENEGDFSSAYIIDTLIDYRPGKVYCGSLPYGAQLLLGRSEVYEKQRYINSKNFETEYFSRNGAECFYLESEDMSALICFDAVFDYSGLPEKMKNADIIISRNDYPQNIVNENCRLFVINSENARGLIIQDEMSESGVRCVATAGCGDILIRGESGFVSASRK